MNVKKHVMSFLNSPQCDHSTDGTCDDCQKIQQIIDGMSMGTATLVIKKVMENEDDGSFTIKDLANKGRYYTASVVDADGKMIHRMLVDKQNGEVRFV